MDNRVLNILVICKQISPLKQNYTITIKKNSPFKIRYKIEYNETFLFFFKCELNSFNSSLNKIEMY